MPLSSLKYFMKRPMGASMEIGPILDNPNHDLHEIVKKDAAAIPHDALHDFCNTYRIERLIAHRDDKDLARRTWYLEFQIARKITDLRVQLLRKNTTSEFYMDEELNTLSVDDNGLIPVKEFELFNFGICLNEHVYQMCPILDEANSSHWLSRLILNESFKNNKNFRIRLDPLVKVKKQDFAPSFQLMHLHGKRLDWERLKVLRNEEFGQWLGEGLSLSSLHITDYVWRPTKTEVHFTCEELPKENSIMTRGSRYFHAIFDKSSGNIIHCDGAIRYYNADEYKFRMNYHVRNPEVRKIGSRIKMFQIDEGIDQHLFLGLASSFFVWNEDAVEYFK